MSRISLAGSSSSSRIGGLCYARACHPKPMKISHLVEPAADNIPLAISATHSLGDEEPERKKRKKKDANRHFSILRAPGLGGPTPSRPPARAPGRRGMTTHPPTRLRFAGRGTTSFPRPADASSTAQAPGRRGTTTHPPTRSDRPSVVRPASPRPADASSTAQAPGRRGTTTHPPTRSDRPSVVRPASPRPADASSTAQAPGRRGTTTHPPTRSDRPSVVRPASPRPADAIAPSRGPAAVRADDYPSSHPLKIHPSWDDQLPPVHADANAPLACEPGCPAGSAPDTHRSPRSTGGGAAVVPAPFPPRRSAPRRALRRTAARPLLRAGVPRRRSSGSADHHRPAADPELLRRYSHRGTRTFPPGRLAAVDGVRQSRGQTADPPSRDPASPRPADASSTAQAPGRRGTTTHPPTRSRSTGRGGRQRPHVQAEQAPPLELQPLRGRQPPPGARTVRNLIACSCHRTGHDTGPTSLPASRRAPPEKLRLGPPTAHPIRRSEL